MLKSFPGIIEDCYTKYSSHKSCTKIFILSAFGVISSRTDISPIRQNSIMLVLRDTEIKGRGIFAHQDFAKGELIETAPVIVIPKQQVKLIVKTLLLNYYFAWHGESGAIALCFASLFNHSYHPNALHIEKIAKSVIEIIAHQDIRKGQEITINYNGQVDDQSPVWFDVVE